MYNTNNINILLLLGSLLLYVIFMSICDDLCRFMTINVDLCRFKTELSPVNIENMSKCDFIFLYSLSINTTPFLFY